MESRDLYKDNFTWFVWLLRCVYEKIPVIKGRRREFHFCIDDYHRSFVHFKYLASLYINIVFVAFICNSIDSTTCWDKTTLFRIKDICAFVCVVNGSEQKMCDDTFCSHSIDMVINRHYGTYRYDSRRRPQPNPRKNKNMMTHCRCMRSPFHRTLHNKR